MFQAQTWSRHRRGLAPRHPRSDGGPNVRRMVQTGAHCMHVAARGGRHVRESELRNQRQVVRRVVQIGQPRRRHVAALHHIQHGRAFQLVAAVAHVVKNVARVDAELAGPRRVVRGVLPRGMRAGPRRVVRGVLPRGMHAGPRRVVRGVLPRGMRAAQRPTRQLRACKGKARSTINTWRAVRFRLPICTHAPCGTSVRVDALTECRN